MLQQLIEVQIKWGQEDECKANLNKLKTIVSMDSQPSQPKLADARTKKSTKGGRQKRKTTKEQKAVTNTEESDEEDFIKSRPLSFSRTLAGGISVDMSSSPSLRPAPVCSSKLPGYVDHQKGCNCNQCTDHSLHDLQTGYYLGLAGYYVLLCNNEAAKATLVMAKELLEWSNECLHQVFKLKLSMLDIQSSFLWMCHHRSLCKVVSTQALVELEMGCFDKALSSAQEGLALCESNSIPIAVDLVVQASFHYYVALAGIHMKAMTSGNSVFDSSWTLVRGKNMDSASDAVNDVANQLSQLSMSVTAKQRSSVKDTNLSCRLFQNMLDTSTSRPEMTRKRDSRGSEQDAVLPEELGLFGDVIFDETDKIIAPAKGKPKTSESRAKSAVQVTTKKGAVKFKVAKKPSRISKNPEVVDLTTLSDDADGVFSFEEETVCNSKKPAKGRGKKGCSKQAALKPRETGEASDLTTPEDSLSSLTTTKKSRGKGRGASKKDICVEEASVVDNNSEILKMVDEIIGEFSDTESVKKDEAVDAQPKRGRGRKAKDTSNDTGLKETKPRTRRGRVKKGDSGDIENTRGDPDPENPEPGPPELLKILHDDSMNENITIDALPHSPSSSDVESPSRLELSFENISPCKHQPEVSISDAAMQKKLKAAKKVNPRSSSKGSESSVECTVPLVDMNTSSSSFLETPAELDLSIGKVFADSQDDLDDIEIPRAGSDSEDTGKKGKRRGRGTKKTSVWEDVEAPRGCGKHLEEKKSRAGSKKSSKTGAEVADSENACRTGKDSFQQAFSWKKESVLNECILFI